MPQFFLRNEDVTADEGLIRGDDYHHLIDVRRIKTGDDIQCRDEDGTEYKATVAQITGEHIALHLEQVRAQNNNKIKLHLCLALLKGKNFDLALQKAVEVGVSSIIPLITERTVPRIDHKAEKLSARWDRIVLEAAKQSLGQIVPQVQAPAYFADAVNLLTTDSCGICGHPAARPVPEDFFNKKYDEYYVLVGPEGGFSEKEISLAREKGWNIYSFLSNHLRAETAAIVLPALILYEAAK